ncbi:MAG: hypothetical protein JWP28_129 [Phenylobacterium sp.]|uniref:hypothetical protein n=1 Tax=Phenylobacterium sp. TaxID=1871053 RepID=UPI0026238566|nr:hypothetical protein [Phenylobacterium sp.]MDB5496098.1 hypothetical protein [Phenylobacterium sp.]
MTAAQGTSRLLVVCRAVGWLLGLFVAIAFLLLLWAGQRTVAGEQRRSDVTAGAFIARVKACRRQSPGPPPSWNACERRVRANL